MKRKVIEWTIFGIVATGLMVIMGWFLPRAMNRFVPWAVARFKVATRKQHVPAGARANAELRRRLREEENRLARGAGTVRQGTLESSPCLVLPVQAGIRAAHREGVTAAPGTGPGRPANPIRHCLDLVPGVAPVNAVEVNLNNVKVMFVQTDLYLPGDPPIAFTRVVQRYVHWNSKYQIYLPDEYLTFPTGHRNPYTDMTVWLADK